MDRAISTRRCFVGFGVGVILAIHGVLLSISAIGHSPVLGEVGHLSAGLSHIYLGRFDLFRVNPPLVRTIAAIPVAMSHPVTNWQSYSNSPLVRSEFEVGQDFVTANTPQTLWYISAARLACVPFCLLGGYICFCWANELYGSTAGFLALVLWCSCPYILGHGALLTADAPAAAIGIMAYYCFWRWLNGATPRNTIVLGITLGLAELTKFTLLAFYPLMIVTWAIYKLSECGLRRSRKWCAEAGMLLVAFIISIVAIIVGYEGEQTFQSLGEYHFQSQLLSGAKVGPDVRYMVGNRFANTWLGYVPVPLPANYLQGIDTQRWDFERKMWSYLAGTWRFGGWWYYYIYALTIKIPLGTWTLLLLAVVVSVFGRVYSALLRDEIVLLLPAIAILLLVSSQTGFSIHSRYALPILPFLFIWISKVGRCVGLQHWKVASVGAAALCWSVSSSLWYYPHSLSYFNELVGGPVGGHAHLLDSNIAWGQDLPFLKRWYDEHPNARPLRLAYLGPIDPRLAGIEFALPPNAPTSTNQASDIPARSVGPLPGWYAIDVNHLHGARLVTSDGQGGWQTVAKDGRDLTYFQQFEPVAAAGYSIYIYHITLDEANRVRRDLGIKELKNDNEEFATRTGKSHG